VTPFDEEDSSPSRNDSSSRKSDARRRVDAYHEALRDRLALLELEQPFLGDGASQGAWRRR
jgi:hypothetical protein